MRKMNAVPLAAKRARSEVPQMELTALLACRVPAVCLLLDLAASINRASVGSLQ